MDKNHHDIMLVQRWRGFTHHTAAKLFDEGAKLFKTDPKRAESLFRTVVQIEPDNPYGWLYLLFTQEDTGQPLSALVTTCSKLISVAVKKPIHGLDGLSKQIMAGYLQHAEEMGLKIR
jgi:hypothetical protein